jgi:hypothetical protein
MSIFNLPVEYEVLSIEERRIVREQYVKEQGGLCYHCKGLLSERVPEEILKYRIHWKLFPPNFLRYPVHLHHSHESGLTIGVVHAYCNAVLWQYHGE